MLCFLDPDENNISPSSDICQWASNTVICLDWPKEAVAAGCFVSAFRWFRNQQQQQEHLLILHLILPAIITFLPPFSLIIRRLLDYIHRLYSTIFVDCGDHYPQTSSTCEIRCKEDLQSSPKSQEFQESGEDSKTSITTKISHDIKTSSNQIIA